MNPHRRVGSRAPFMGLTAAVLALLLLPTLVLGAEWTSLRRVGDVGGSRLDSLHQLAAGGGKLHLLHPRIGPKTADDRIVYQRSGNDGASWSKEKTIFSASSKHRNVVPNLAIDSRGNTVAAAWRVGGPKGTTLFVRVSRDGGKTFGLRRRIFSTSKDGGIGVPAVAVGSDFIAVAWSNRASGKVKLRLSRNDGRTYSKAQTLGRTKLSIDCAKKVTDGLVGLAAAGKNLHLAWSLASEQSCVASSIRVRTSPDRGTSWSRRRTITKRSSYGWPELDARGKTVLATMQSPSGGLVVARSTKNGRHWSDLLMKAPKGHNYSAADVVLLSGKKAMITYVNETIEKERLVRTKVVSRRSPNDGLKWNKARTAAPGEDKLRMAPNIAVGHRRVAIVVQSGQLDGSPRGIFATRLR